MFQPDFLNYNLVWPDWKPNISTVASYKLHAVFLRYAYQCQLLTLVASARSSTIQRGSPSPHLAMTFHTLLVSSKVQARAS